MTQKTDVLIAKDLSSDDILDVSALVAPEDCLSMIDVREGVDELDRILVELLFRRQGFMDAAARIKPEFNHVRDEKRIEDVVSKVLNHAQKIGLSAHIAEPVWRLLIERCIAYEGEIWNRLDQEGMK